ncbi:guanine nucleotide-binding protein G(I)/G(S)/G(O) subunit gamma-2 isoform X1 [Phacochoerus africanus]|uniref:guanine nucleotide-binding protein G(I)/G(S)/G(O) subunit gamma-2 isoform X1 n=1 Tax=Phacochoerus africanus TaxID=41426 RepID=UPI001FD8838F|nr:guanine nucleotide-binding protein G(I)/G(S)/G(O) subunit gamma-2 isoform X1 [Phacochoerus africanus]
MTIMAPILQMRKSRHGEVEGRRRWHQRDLEQRGEGDSSHMGVSCPRQGKRAPGSSEMEQEGKKQAARSSQEEEVGDAPLPVERRMIEDKAGWGLVPGLRALLLHIHTRARAHTHVRARTHTPRAARRGQLLLLRGWAGLAALELRCTQRLGEGRKATLLGPASGAKVGVSHKFIRWPVKVRSSSEPRALGTEECV